MGSASYSSIEIAQDPITVKICSFCHKDGGSLIQDTMCPCGCVLPIHTACLHRATSSSAVQAVCPECRIPWLHALTIPLIPQRKVVRREQRPWWRICVEVSIAVAGLSIISVIVWFAVKYNRD